MDELNTAETPVEPLEPSTEPAVVSEPAEAGSQPAAATPTPAEIYDYTKDERSKGAWFNKATKAFDANLMYKSYRNAEGVIEKQYKPLRAQADAFQSIFKEFGFQADANEIRQALTELKALKDPEHPVMKLGNFVKYFADNPEYNAEVSTFLETLRKREIRKQFGEGVSDEVVNEIIANRKFREEQETKEKQRQLQSDADGYTKEINDGWDKVTKEAKNLGFPIDENMKAKVMTEFAKLGVPPKFVYHQFMEMYKDEIDKHRRAKIQSEITKARINQHKNGIIPGSSKPSSMARPQTAGKGSLLDRVKKTVGLTT